MMKLLLGLAVVGMGAGATSCVPQQQSVASPHALDTPFGGPPQIAWTDDQTSGYRVELQVPLQRDVVAADQLAFVVRVAGDEVGRYPIAHGVHGTTIHQKVDLPLGDYDIELEYRGQHFAGSPFRIAVVPEWGGARQLHLFKHHGTRIDLADRKLWVLRWWSNDAPTLPWVIEWRQGDRAVATTRGRERKWDVQGVNAFIQQAIAPQARRSIWQLGEEYGVPDVVAKTPGQWEARIVREGAPPVAIAFTVLANAEVGDAARELVSTPTGWKYAWSNPLALRPLAASESAELSDQLLSIAGAQRFADGPIELTPSAVRALFRSKQLVESWTKLLAGSNALRPMVEQLIKTNGGPWRADEFPKS